MPEGNSYSRPDAVLVTYNSEGDLRRQLAGGSLTSAFGSVIAVDNGSSDDSVGLARELGAEVLVLPDNPGFGAAVNHAVRRSSARSFVVLNPDVRFESPAVVEGLADELETTGAGLVAPGLRLPDGSLQDSARTFPGPTELVRRRLSGQALGAVATLEARDVDWVVGACMVIRRDAFDAVGGFDERYHLYFEDVDLCLRLWQAGWRVRIQPDFEAFHDHRGASRDTFLGGAMRRHLTAAARFYAHHPSMRTPGRRAAPQNAPRHVAVTR